MELAWSRSTNVLLILVCSTIIIEVITGVPILFAQNKGNLDHGNHFGKSYCGISNGLVEPLLTTWLWYQD